MNITDEMTKAGMEVLGAWKQTDEYDERKLVNAIFTAMQINAAGQVNPTGDATERNE